MISLAEINTRFDIGYNNSFSNTAPPIEMIEKSIYLTLAEEEIVKELAKTFETSERAREILKPLVKVTDISYDSNFNQTHAAAKFNSSSKLFALPTGLWLILNEGINDSDDITVIPVPLDEVSRNIKNPFKQPNVDKVWRLDTASTTDANITQLIYPSAISKYNLVYMVKPGPIILEALPEGFTLHGLTSPTNCVLNDIVINDIIERAIVLAKLAYEEKGSLAARVNLK